MLQAIAEALLPAHNALPMNALLTIPAIRCFAMARRLPFAARLMIAVVPFITVWVAG
jgi:hypothetical protein